MLLRRFFSKSSILTRRGSGDSTPDDGPHRAIGGETLWAQPFIETGMSFRCELRQENVLRRAGFRSVRDKSAGVQKKFAIPHLRHFIDYATPRPMHPTSRQT